MIRPSLEETAALLASTRLFAGIAPESFTGILEAGQVVNLAPGRVIYNRGDEAQCGFVLLSGRVELVETPYPGRRLSSQLFAAGSLFAEKGFVGPWVHKRQCTAVEASSALAITPEALTGRLEQSDAAAMRLIDSLLDVFVRNLRGANQRLDEIFSRPDRTLNQLRQMNN